ncbi:peptidase M23 [Aliarcobacter trophiarum LMG 25534]|uniref:Peptidase M23 n=1 Tax=Aliarcobacter trophiarum LMG 25534 TaxID=1032241 RepID=A0AAD0VMH8_9BACT|nr:M23 family metallopeptidase [Aliarcobacter trophiarum]AXK48931.1 zinc metallopeptidase, M23 family [Aliarcobacter trophiarum LMG 25534]RXI24888.1 peptidase M23 [Aliarcobacter trophiarum]RXJ92662.1 peptidase M23 [Aliarcobacter trophiarum LMG 25534]
MDKYTNRYITFTINNDNGIKQLRVSKKPLFYILYTLLGLFFAFSIAFVFINLSLIQMDKDRLDIELELVETKRINEELNNLLSQTQLELHEKNEEISEATDYFNKVENIIGIPTENELPLKQRVDIARLDTEQRTTLLQLIPSGSPLEDSIINSYFGYRHHPVLKRKALHMGVDLKATIGTPVYATADGIIETASFDRFNGNLVIIQHIYGFKSYYAHLNKTMVKSGSFVKKGDLIAYSGNTGISSGPHLHYEIRFLSKSLDPLTFVMWGMKNYTEIFEKETEISWDSLITAISHIKVQDPTPQPQLSLQEQK